MDGFAEELSRRRVSSEWRGRRWKKKPGRIDGDESWCDGNTDATGILAKGGESGVIVLISLA